MYRSISEMQEQNHEKSFGKSIVDQSNVQKHSSTFMQNGNDFWISIMGYLLIFKNIICIKFSPLTLQLLSTWWTVCQMRSDRLQNLWCTRQPPTPYMEEYIASLELCNNSLWSRSSCLWVPAGLSHAISKYIYLSVFKKSYIRFMSFGNCWHFQSLLSNDNFKNCRWWCDSIYSVPWTTVLHYIALLGCPYYIPLRGNAK